MKSDDPDAQPTAQDGPDARSPKRSEGRRRREAAPPIDPAWYKNAVIYQLHVRSFCDSTGDGVGDFNGLISKLDYLADLGVTALWLLPFYPSPLRDDGYDIADFTSVHPSYGTLEDARRFIQEAHRRDIKVITELVVNHTSDQHPWFQRARRAPKGSPEREYYVWSDSPEKYAGTRIIFKDFESSNWTWDPVAGQYYWHRFYSHQPDLNFNNPAVQKAVLDACSFWMRRGVDGMRLDAIPYLYEREGTSCENLPETHEFLRKLRAHVEKHFPGRMLLAEANQWPEDAIAYFGKGDECHMAFHFPLMPRLFMALRMEDRAPIVDILEQTPPIPPGCQWAVFLRNHDELTLEMVTDEERDYMYRVYATDPEARINLGIRRRLAPLLSNNRRKIELMNALLFSLPGTPIIYYGDEIGMGDNVYLGDRNGVRTPMQWSGDRNAGFSRANPQRLFLPTIIDPEYHFEAINVESQIANPSSILWWTKRLIALRRRHPVFGRGSMRFLTPENGRVLAFIRQEAEQTVLVVANLSRFVQPVSLPLKEFEGHRPVEVFGRVAFPVIAGDSYFLSLGPHSFYWFLLEAPAPARAAEPSTSLPVWRVAGPAERVLTAEARVREFERLLTGIVPGRPWFAAQGRVVRAARVVERVPVAAAGLPRGSGAIVLARCELSSGEPEVYALPLVVRPPRPGGPGPPDESVLAAMVSGDGGPFELADGLAEPEFARSVLGFTQRGERAEAGGSQIEAIRAGPPLAEAMIRSLAPKLASAGRGSSTVLFGESYLLRFFHRLEIGRNPELEIAAHLTERVFFPNAAPLAGAAELVGANGERRTLAVAFELGPRGSAWDWFIDQAAAFLERAARVPAGAGGAMLAPPAGDELMRADPPAALLDLIREAWDAARLLGRRTAELHAALADARGDPAFTPEPLTPMDQRSMLQSMRGTVRTGLAALKAAPPASGASAAAAEIIAAEGRFLAMLRPLAERPLSGSRIRTHGDLGLTHVLWTGADFIFTNFEGDPTRSIGERRLKRPPLRDVAGMIRSFDHAAWEALRRRGERPPAGASASAARAVSDAGPVSAGEAAVGWAAWMSRAFAGSYAERVRELQPSLLGEDRSAWPVLLRVFLIERVLHEITSEAGRGRGELDGSLTAARAMLAAATA